MIYIFCERKSEGADSLAQDLLEEGLGGRATSWPKNLKKGDLILCWGTHQRAQVPPGVFVLNGDAPGPDKYQQLKKFHLLDLLAPPCLAENPKHLGLKGEWLGRSLLGKKGLAHFDGGDLLNPPENPDYWTKKVPLVHEYRIHVLPKELSKKGGVGIRFGKKEPYKKDAHPWIKSYQAGWSLLHGSGIQAQRTPEMDKAAVAAVSAVGLDFGAVDFGTDKEGNVWLLEVNTAPGLQGMPTSIQAYVSHLKKLVS